MASDRLYRIRSRGASDEPTFLALLASDAVALLALFVALGGSSYAALKIGSKQIVNNSVRGKDVRNNDLTGKDVRNGRLGGADIRNGAIASADVRDGSLLAADLAPGQLPAPVDPAQFLPAAGSTLVSVGPTNWVPDELSLTEVGANRADFTSTTASGSGAVILHPQLPSALAGKAMRLRAVTICADATDAGATIANVFITQFRGPLASGSTEQVAQLTDPTDRDDSVCRRYELPAPFMLADGDFVGVVVGVVWTAVGAEVQLAGTTLELDRP